MYGISTELILILLGALIVLSYLFSIISRVSKIPSVLLLLVTGIFLRALADYFKFPFILPGTIVELFGAIGLIMIVLEAGLDLQLAKNKLPLIRQAFLSALIVFVVSAIIISAMLHFWLQEPIIHCIIYSIPLSIMSSSIVLPSLHHLNETKKDFLVYEASFSDIIGILIFNYFIGKEILSMLAVGKFFLAIVISVILSIVFSLILFLILVKSKLNVKIFLVFALLIMLYEGGKLLSLPSLLIILVFGLMMRNWNLVRIPFLRKFFSENEIDSTTTLLHSVTAESSFLIRTFFFVLFGFTIDLHVIADNNVLMLGGAIVAILLLTRFLYLRFFLKESVYPEVVFIPRGLVTILLFYKIPAEYKLASFNDGILFFVILVTSLIMMIGMLFYKPANEDSPGLTDL